MPAPAARPSRKVTESAHETSVLMMPPDENARGHVFGGVVLALMDKAAAVCAMRHARTSCVTVSVDRVDFREPILVGDLVHMKASVNFVGRSTMEIGIRIEAENMLLGTRRHTNSCYVTYVALDRDGRPTEVPSLVLETDAERRRHAAGKERRRRRDEERELEKARLKKEGGATGP
jgi:acyl-CoA hydrolase